MSIFNTQLSFGDFSVKVDNVLTVNSEYEWELNFKAKVEMKPGSSLKIIVPPYQHQRSEEYLQTYDYWQKNYIYAYGREDNIRVDVKIEKVPSEFSHINRWRDSSRVAIVHFDKGLKVGDEIVVKFGGIDRPWLEGECEPSRISQHAYKHGGTFLTNEVYIDVEGIKSYEKLDVFPRIRIIPDKVRKIIINTPMVIKRNEKFEIDLLFVDRFNNPVQMNSDEFTKIVVKNLKTDEISYVEEENGKYWGVLQNEGYYEINAEFPDGDVEASIVVCNDIMDNIYWGDTHFHSNLTANIRDNDPGALPDYGYTYAKEVSKLDFVCMSEQTFQFNDNRSVNVDKHTWDEIGQKADEHYVEGLFTTFPGIELHSKRGDTIILFGESFSEIDYPSESVDEVYKIWRYYENNKVLTIPHFHRYCEGRPRKDQQEIKHEGFNMENWIQSDDKEVLCEIYSSQWGRFENQEHPMILKARANVKGNSFQEFLTKRKKWGVTAGSDGHDGNPGYGGITGVLAKRNSRQDIFDSLKKRRTIATTHPRMFINLSVEGYSIGEISTKAKEARTIHMEAVAPTDIKSIELIKNEEVLVKDTCGKKFFVKELVDFKTNEEDRYYVRVKLKNGHLGWCSPIWFDDIDSNN